MPVTRNGKTRSGQTPSKQSSSSVLEKGIGHYGRVTKSGKPDKTPKKHNVALEEAVKAIKVESNVKSGSATQLRSHGPSPPPQPSEPSLNESTVPPSRKRRHQDTDLLQTPSTKRFKDACLLPPTPAETPSKRAMRLFDKLSIAPVVNSQLAAPSSDYDTPPLTPRSLVDTPQLQNVLELPAPLQDLVRLFSSFLTSTSLFYAHNGPGSPLYLGSLLKNVTAAWKKRSVTEVDVRRLLGVLGDETFTMVDNGEGLIGLEQNGGTAPGHFNQPLLKDRFHERLSQLWAEWVSRSADNRQHVMQFIDQIPLASVACNHAARVPGSRLAKGHQLLDDLKKGAVQARSDEKKAQRPVVSSESKTAAGVSDRGTSLLDRILAKRQVGSSGGAGPTRAELDRNAALNRIEDIVPVLDILAGSKPRVSFSYPALLSNLQNSLRNPISKEEVERCIDLMAREIVPTYLSIIQAGQVKGIVLTKAGRPSNAELRRRLAHTDA